MTTLEFLGALLVLTGGLGLLHSYLLYPLSWVILRRFHRPNRPVDVSPSPSVEGCRVSVIVAAYNEERHIAARVRNLIDSDYPVDQLEILVASDGSSDCTVALASEAAEGHPQVRILDFPERRGKISVLNDVCAQTSGDVLVFTDANVEFKREAITRLVAALADPRAGCACGRLVFRSPTGASHEQSEGLYWKLETWLKIREGGAGCLLGANGAIYAMKRELWQPCPADTLVDDFFIPMRLLMSGWRVVYAADAVAEEDLPPRRKDEFGRRVRIGAGNWQALTRCFALLHPRQGLRAWVFFSHKVLRWSGPFLMIMLALGTLLLLAGGQRWALLLAALQVMAYGCGLLGLARPDLPGAVGRLTGSAAHFLAMNAGLFMGFVRWTTGTQGVTWNRTRR